MADFCSIFLSLAQNFHFPLATLEAISLAGCGSIVLPLTTDPVAFELPAFLRQVRRRQVELLFRKRHMKMLSKIFRTYRQMVCESQTTRPYSKHPSFSCVCSITSAEQYHLDSETDGHSGSRRCSFGRMIGIAKE